MSRSGSLARRVWRDGAVRALPLWLVIVVLAGNVMAVAVTWRAGQMGSSGPPHSLMVLALWLPMALFLLLGKGRARGHRLELALPIPARELWLSHGVAMALAAVVILATGFAILGLVGLLMARFYGGPDPAQLLLVLIPPTVAATALGIVLVQGTQPGAWKPSRDGGGWGRLLGGVVLIPTALILLQRWPLAAAAGLIAIAGVLARRAWVSLPAALELTPLVERQDGLAASAAGLDDGSASALGRAAPGHLTLSWLVFNVLHNAPPWRRAMPWLLYSFIPLVAFFQAGGFATWLELDESRVINLPLGAYMLFTGAGILSYHLHRMDPLPISRTHLFRLLVLPSLLFFCLGWGAGRLVLAVTAGSRPLVDYRIAGVKQRVAVDPAYLGISTDGQVPMLDSPWGETHPARRYPLFAGSRLAVYSPFDTPEASSARFEALMTSRAIERVYGQAIPADEILSRHFEVENGRIVAFRSDGLTLAEDHPELSPQRRGADTPVYLSLTLVPWLLLMAGFVRTFRASSSLRLVRAAYYTGLGILLLALIGQVIAAIAGLYSPIAAYGLLTIFCHWLAADPLRATLAWLLCAVLVGVSYRSALGGFRRAELPASPLQCALVDWGKGG